MSLNQARIHKLPRYEPTGRAAAILNISPWTLRSLAKDRKIDHLITPSGRFMFNVEDYLERYGRPVKD